MDDYRAVWGNKDARQKRILAIDIMREGFEWALAHSCSSHPAPSMTKQQWNQFKQNTPARIQWGPERNLLLEPLPYRAIQIGLSKEVVKRYMNQWIQRITDVTPLAHSICTLVRTNKQDEALLLLPKEAPYPIQSMPNIDK